MRRVLIFTTKTDQYIGRFRSEARESGIDVRIYTYEKLSFVDNRLTYRGQKSFPEFDSQQAILFRRCEYDRLNQHFWLRTLALLAKQAGALVLNQDYNTSFPMHSGKLFQAALFASNGIRHISTYRLSSRRVIDYPVIAKKRYSAFGRDAYVLGSAEDLAKLKGKVKRLSDYIYQPYLELDRDVRVFILNNKVLAVAKRSVRIKEGGRVGVAVSESAGLTPAELELVETILAKMRLGIAGVDLFTSRSGKVWVGEINYYPNFEAIERVSNVNVFKEILLLLSGK